MHQKWTYNVEIVSNAINFDQVRGMSLFRFEQLQVAKFSANSLHPNLECRSKLKLKATKSTKTSDLICVVTSFCIYYFNRRRTWKLVCKKKVNHSFTFVADHALASSGILTGRTICVLADLPKAKFFWFTLHKQARCLKRFDNGFGRHPRLGWRQPSQGPPSNHKASLPTHLHRSSKQLVSKKS